MSDSTWLSNTSSTVLSYLTKVCEFVLSDQYNIVEQAPNEDYDLGRADIYIYEHTYVYKYIYIYTFT